MKMPYREAMRQALHDALGVDIPESDYAKLVTLDDLAAYLGSRIA